MQKRILVLILAVLFSVTLWGCGSNRDSDGIVSDGGDLGADPETGIAYVGASTCIGCHEGFSWSAEVVADYLAGKHVIHSDHINAGSNDDYEGYDCLGCHDPIGDGPGLEALIAEEDVPEAGLAAVGCENCHGAGGDHFGIGPIPMASPGIDACATCHEKLPENHLSHHPEADNISSRFVESRHYTASVRNEAICSKCHTDEGGRLYKDVSTRTQLEATVLPVASDEPVQCRTCHNPHNAGGLLMEEVEDHGHVVASAEYATCTTCHMSDKDTPDDEVWMYHEDRYYRVITDTHYDDPETTDRIEGYVIDPLSERACRDCHDVHAVMEIRADEDSRNFSNTINDQWSKSAHGGFIGEIKLGVAEAEDDAGRDRTIEQTLAIKAAGVEEEDAAAWVHYDWDAENRQSCQECHTATGAANYLNDPENYDAANNDFSHLVGWEVSESGGVTPSGQAELLYCWGCHSDNNGGLRNPGAITRPYAVGGVDVTIPDVGNSNVCINCHGARGNVEEYELTEDPTTDMSDLNAGFGPGTKNVTEAHYLVAAATIFAAETRIGYEYSDPSTGALLDYTPHPIFAHDSIATDEINDDGEVISSGPCVACHMGEDGSHFFAVVEKDEAGVITNVPAKAVCDTCHTPGASYEVTATMLEEEAEGYHEALEILETGLADLGAVFSSSYPYFNTSVAGSWINEGVFGAAHNFNYLHHEPGAYAHNRFYAKRLLFDSIDWIDNYTLDGTITIDDTVYPEAAHWLGADETTGEATRP